jgi:branched-chain amino acid aminotransferase
MHALATVLRRGAPRALPRLVRAVSVVRDLDVRVLSLIDSLQSSLLSIEPTRSPKVPPPAPLPLAQPKQPKESLKFGSTFTDHMLEIDWDAASGWGRPVIRPYGPISLDPSASVFHYAVEVRVPAPPASRPSALRA